jgi:hypothetical protein
VRLLRRHRHLRHHEPDPMAALRLHDENLAIEGRVARLRQAIWLSYRGNTGNRVRLSRAKMRFQACGP